MELDKDLRAYGLSKSEIKVYLYLLECGLATPPQIAKGTGIARTNTYHLLRSLAEKDVIEEQKRGKRKAYFASDPEVLIFRHEKKKDALEKLLPELAGLYQNQKNKPRVRYFDGWPEVKTMWSEMLAAKRIYGFASTSKLFKLSPGFFEDFRQKIKSQEIEFYDIVSYESGKKAVQQSKREIGERYRAKVLPRRYEDLPTDVLVWNNNVLLVSTEEPVFATMLTNKSLARTFVVMFELMWSALGKEV